MKRIRVTVQQDGDSYVGHVHGPRTIATQGRTLDELVFMVRDAIALMWEETDVELELIVSSDITVSQRKKAWGKRATA